MAENLPDSTPTWLAVAISVVVTVTGLRVWGPVGRWVARRLDADRQAKLVARADMIEQLNVELRASREEAVQLRQELAEERELRMTFAQDYAVLKRDVDHLTKALAEDKRDCQREIRRLTGEIRALKGEITELRAHQRGEMTQ